jgi:Ran-binding protein 3
MRSDGVWRVILNSPVFKGMKAGDASGKEPTDKQVHLAGIENGRTVPFLLRTGKIELARELYHTIQDLQPYL